MITSVLCQIAAIQGAALLFTRSVFRSRPKRIVLSNRQPYLGHSDRLIGVFFGARQQSLARPTFFISGPRVDLAAGYFADQRNAGQHFTSLFDKLLCSFTLVAAEDRRGNIQFVAPDHL